MKIEITELEEKILTKCVLAAIDNTLEVGGGVQPRVDTLIEFDALLSVLGKLKGMEVCKKCV